ncbi:MAG: acylphosphatase [Methylococcales bacterium]|nr:acylphosphatase [Methylococcales bacterium]
MNQVVKILISGRVQGVCFRAAAKKQADKLGIKGYAENLDNGSVEIKAIADKALIDQLIDWSHKGSLFSVVKKVAVTYLNENESFNQFSIK